MTAAELAADILALGPDHRDALMVMRRIGKAIDGRRKYGPINLADDKRNFLVEALAEGIDKEWYMLFEIVRLERENDHLRQALNGRAR